MKQFLIKNQDATVSLLLKYNGDLLTEFAMEGELNPAQVNFFRKMLPWLISDLEWYNTSPKFRVKEIEPDLSFKNFWNLYANKVGNKPQAERLYNALSKTQKAKALAYIVTYDQQLLKTPGVQKAHATTYLNQKRFDNE